MKKSKNSILDKYINKFNKDPRYPCFKKMNPIDKVKFIELMLKVYELSDGGKKNLITIYKVSVLLSDENNKNLLNKAKNGCN